MRKHVTEDCQNNCSYEINKNQRKIVKIYAGCREKVQNQWNERHSTYLSVSFHDSC